MVGFAMAAPFVTHAFGGGWLHGLRLAAVAVVAQAVLSMTRTLAPDRERATLAVMAALAALWAPMALTQLAVIAVGLLIGLMILKPADGEARPALPVIVGPRAGAVSLGLFALLLAGLPIAASLTGSHGVDLFARFYKVGYGWAGALVCLSAIFLPSFFLIVGALPFWNALRHQRWAQGALMGANAAVVGLLAAALYNPVWTSAVTSLTDVGLVLTAFLLLAAWRAPPWVVVALTAVAAGVMG
jgi:chromate transporter